MSPVVRTRRRCANACGNCKRRKEGCDGAKPCQRCRTRGVTHECHFTAPVVLPAHLYHGADVSETLEGDRSDWSSANLLVERYGNELLRSTNRPTPQQDKPLPGLFGQGDGSFTFLGDSSAAAMLQNVRQLAKNAIGDCPLVSTSPNLLEGPPADERRPSDMTGLPIIPPKPGLIEAQYLVKWYLYGTACFVDLFDEDMLMDELSSWLLDGEQRHDWTSSRYFLVLALGAQICPEERDFTARRYYTYSRALTQSDILEESSTSLVAAQCYTLTTLYLVNDSRLNAAFMHFGHAVRAAYGLGLHRTDLVADFTPPECDMRQRLWKTIRVLDVFLSTTLGRPLATCKPWTTATVMEHSTIVDICTIYELVLNEAFVERPMETGALHRIMDLNRQWAARFLSGLQTAGIRSSEHIELGDDMLPNIGLLHLKQAFYGATILLTQRYLERSISSSTKSRGPRLAQEQVSPCSPTPQLLGLACVQSAIDSIEIFRELLVAKQTPKHLPLMVNSVFHAVLVLGAATFNDLCSTSPIDEYLGTACKLLSMFGNHDWLAKKCLGISMDLRSACRKYLERKSQTELESQRALVRELFGNVDGHRYTKCRRSIATSDSVEHSARSPTHRENLGPDASPETTQTIQGDPPRNLEMGVGTTDFSGFPDLLDETFLNSTQSDFFESILHPLYESNYVPDLTSQPSWSDPFGHQEFPFPPVDASRG